MKRFVGWQVCMPCGLNRLLVGIAAVLVACSSVNASTITSSSAAATAVPVTYVATVAKPVPTPTFQPTNPQTFSSAAFTQLTTGGCCVQPFFSPDGARVLYLDKPAADTPTGIWAVEVNKPLSAPQLFSQSLGPFSRDMAYAADLVNKQTIVRRLSDGAQFRIDNGGRAISFSPDATRIAWTVDEEAGGFDMRRSDMWLANIDGKNARRVVSRFGGGPVAWLPDNQHMLIGGKIKRTDDKPTLSILNLADGGTRDLVQVERLRGGALSPNGHWFLYSVSQARDTALDGVYLLDLVAAAPQPRRLDIFGAYRWRDASRLLYIPLTLNAPSTELWQIDATTGQQTRLIAAMAGSPFKIANGDWDVARDGTKLIFLSARDRNIWLATLP